MSDVRLVTLDIIDDWGYLPACGRWLEDLDGTHALIPWEEYEAKDAVVEAAKLVIFGGVCVTLFEDALRALDKPTCKTCGGSGRWCGTDCRGLECDPCSPCPDCGGDDE